MGRRSLFFAALAVLSLVMLEPTPDAYRWVNLSAAGLSLFWAVMLFFEERSLARAGSASERRRRGASGGDPEEPTV